MKIYNGVHFYININNLNSIIQDDEESHENLQRTFHALNTFTTTMERYANEFSDVEVEKFTTSRLHFYIPIYNNSTAVLYEMLELSSFAVCLADFINKHSKYQSLINFKMGVGADYGQYTEFNFEDPDSQIQEMTTIGPPANRAAKLQSLCDDNNILVSKEVYDLLDDKMRTLFYGNSAISLKLAKKYADLMAYEANIKKIANKLGEPYQKRQGKLLEQASEIANSFNLGDIKISDARTQLDFSNLSICNTKNITNSVILFADIRGFTKKVDNGNLSEIKQLTQTVLTMMNKQVRDRDGSHVQFQGDRESAVFNEYSNENGNYALRAILCAMKMLDKLDEINAKRYDKLNIGIGCSFGCVFATRIGIRGNKFNVVMGQTVKDADDAEDKIAGVGVEHPKTEIAITSNLYNYISNLPKPHSKLASTFSRRIDGNKIYYVSTTRFSKYQEAAISSTRENNSSRAITNQGIKPWGDK